VRDKAISNVLQNSFFLENILSNDHAKVSSYSPSMALIPPCRAPTLGSTVHHVSVPGLVADTHRSNKIDIKNHTFIDNGKNTLQSSYYIT
jgi:hypothetical protein